MKIYLVRHGKAVKRSRWGEGDELRPLTARGEAQAHSLCRVFEKRPLRRIYSSPAIRCRETVEPLAADRMLSIELDDRLASESGGDGALDLLARHKGAPILICASRSLIVDLLQALEVGYDDPDALRCQKGSVWILERKKGAIVSAEYVPPRDVDRDGRPAERCAVLDVGSTSMSMLVADTRAADGRIEPILRSRVELRLGASAGEIGVANLERILEAGAVMRAEAESTGATKLLPVATASLRDATNGPEVAERLGSTLGVPVRVLSGPEEARIVYAAAVARIGPGKGNLLAFDLGGGSVDLALGCGDRIAYEASEPLGVTRLFSELVHDDPMPASEAKAIRRRVRSGIRGHVEAIAEKKPLRCVVAGGTARALALLIQAERGRSARRDPRGLAITRSEIEAAAVRLRRATHEERLEMATVRAKRADLLPTGASILATLLEELDLDEIRVSDWGLREGILLEQIRARGSEAA